MYIIATFEQTLFVELALTALEQRGIPKEKLFAVPLQRRTEPQKLFDSIHRADGFSIFDLASVLGTCFMLLGAVYGFELKWGPILWGIIGAASGIVLGIVLKLIFLKKSLKQAAKISAEVVLMIRCEQHQQDVVEQILWENTAIGISKVHHSK